MISSSIFKKAVDRNKTKRQIKGIIVKNLKKFKNNFAMVIYLKEKITKEKFKKDLEKELTDIFNQAKIIKNDKFSK